MPKVKYGFAYLTNFCDENKITLLEDYSDIFVTRDTKIKYQCIYENCSKEYEKSLRDLLLLGGYCRSCIVLLGHIKRGKTNMEKYGCKVSLSNKEVQEKMKNTNLEKYGTEYILQSDLIKNRIKKTCLEKYGFENVLKNKSVQDKAKNTLFEKYGVEHPLQIEKAREKFKKTCLEKFGVENPSQNEDVMDKNVKSCFKRKEYAFPSGRIDFIQGYENFALDELIIHEKIDETNIITGCKNVPVIWYEDISGKKRRHYVDIFIPNQNRCIEIKSVWTFQINKCYVFPKQEAAKKLGYNYEIWVYNSKKEKVNIYK